MAPPVEGRKIFQKKKDLKEKLNIDKQTVPGSLVFFVEGSFYSGYERTAFLSARLLPPLKVNCRYYKSVGQTVAVIGFPTSYIPKYAANFPMEQREGMLLLKVPADTPYAKTTLRHENRACLSHRIKAERAPSRAAAHCRLWPMP